MLNIFPSEPRRQVRQAPARRPRNEPGKILVVQPGPVQEAKECPDIRRCRGSGGIVSRQRQEVLHEGEHVLARHLSERLIRKMISKPYENPATRRQKPLAGLRLQATHAQEMILVGGEQRAIGIRWRLAAWRRKPFRRDPARVTDGRSRTNPRTLCPKADQETIDDTLVDHRRSRTPGAKLAELAKPTNLHLVRPAIVPKPAQIRPN